MVDKKPRVRRSREEIAVAELEKATQRVEKAQAKIAELETDLVTARAELSRAQKFADYAAANPDLPAQEPEPEEFDASDVLPAES